MPIRCSANDRFEVMLRSPPNRLSGERIVRHKTRRVSFATRPVFNFEISYNLLYIFKQLFYTYSVARPKIKGVACTPAQQTFDGAGMRLGKIKNVNEVANTGSVSRIIICAQNPEVGSAA